MRRTPIVVTAMAAALGCVSFVSGCGAGTPRVGTAGAVGTAHGNVAADSTGTPAGGDLLAGIAALGARRAVTMTAKLGASPRTLTADSSALGRRLDATQASSLSRLRLSLEAIAPSGSTIAGLRGHPSAGARALDLRSGGATYLQLVRIQGTYYLRGDIQAALAHNCHGPMLRVLRSGNRPAFIRALDRGGWVSVDAATAQLVLHAVSTRMSAPGPQQLGTLLTGLRSALVKDVSVTRVGAAGTTEHLLLRANVATLRRDLLAVVRPVMPALATRLAAVPSGNAPGTLQATATIRHGVLSQLRVNLAQLDPRLHASLPVTVGFRRSGPPITAPAHATPVTLSALLGVAGMFAQRGGGR